MERKKSTQTKRGVGAENSEDPALGQTGVVAAAQEQEALPPQDTKPTKKKAAPTKNDVDRGANDDDLIIRDEPVHLAEIEVIKDHTELPVLRFNYYRQEEVDLEGKDRSEKIPLRKFTLGCLLQEPPALPIQIRTADGAKELLQLCVDLVGFGDPILETEQQGSIKVENVALAVERGLMSLTLGTYDGDGSRTVNKNNYKVTLSLTQYAFETCNPRHLHVQANKMSKVYGEALMLQKALAELFPRYSDMFPVASAAKRDEAKTTITAKQVYELVDNMQIQAYLSKKRPPSSDGTYEKTNNNRETMNIPGLVPTLRKYQEAAVEWMLQRERTPSEQSASCGITTDTGSEEWELAWIIVFLDAGSGSSNNNNGRASNKAQWRIDFLPDYTDYTRHLPAALRKKTRRQLFLFCPFANWLASSVEDARAMTMLTCADPIDRNNNISFARGGILAESMGLGKTVEMLACILANPDPRYRREQVEAAVVSPSTSVSSSSPKSVAVACISDLQQQEQRESCDKREPNKRRKRRRSSIQSPPRAKRNLLAMIEDESGTGSERNSVCEVVQTGRVSPSGSSLSIDSATVFMAPSNLEERWIDSQEYELGSCICGKSISIFPSPQIDSIVLCEGCQEPMHWKCAAFGPEREGLTLQNKGVKYRKKFSNDSYWCRFIPSSYCPCCVANGVRRHHDRKFRSRGTVIVTPPAILCQWEREISHHTLGALKVIVYNGVKNLCSQQSEKDDHEGSCFLHPRFLADADVVLMTFDTLHQDLGHSTSNPFAGGRTSLRKRKRYRVIPSPLSAITWWRVCLDEAQRVETPTAGSAQMALKLDTSHRWCISGTPIGRGKLDDLFGLLLFLRLTRPFNNKYWFRQCFGHTKVINDKYMKKRMKHLLGSVFWRSTKSLKCVADQMGVPAQIEKISVLKFSSIERHFYDRQVKETLQLIGDLDEEKKLLGVKRKGDKSLENLERQLGKLRAACCHPQVGSSGLGTVKKSGGKGTLSMDQILDLLIDDARNKCEERLRLSLFHSNPMATIARLKVEARRDHEVSNIAESDEFLIAKSCKLYQEAIDLADENATPSLVTEEVLLVGSHGFRSLNQKVRGGTVTLGWQGDAGTPNKDNGNSHPWASFEYEGQGKKMRQIRVRACLELPVDLDFQSESTWRLRYPRRCTLQVSNATIGGEFVDVLTIEVPRPERNQNTELEWASQEALPMYKSNIWRILVQSFYPEAPSSEPQREGVKDYVGLEMQLFEPTIGFDSLQRLHTLHNAVISFRQLQTAQRGTKSRENTTPLPLQLSSDEISRAIVSMEEESSKIENYNLECAKNAITLTLGRLKTLTSDRQQLEEKLPQLNKSRKKSFWDVAWWDDILATVTTYGSEEEKHSLCEKVQEACDSCETHTENQGLGDGEWFRFFQSPNSKTPLARKGDKIEAFKAFPSFKNIHGLVTAMKFRIDDEFLSYIRDGRYNQCIMSVLTLSSSPTNQEILENRSCHLCKADWGQTGPMCGHCKVEEKLKIVNTESSPIHKMARNVLKAILRWAKSSKEGVREHEIIRKCVESGTIFFQCLEMSKMEVRAAYRVWTRHLELLNVMDELNSSKTAMRLAHYGEDLLELTEEQRGAVIIPVDVCIKYHEHEVKRASSLAMLRQEKHNLTFLKNQVSRQSTSETCIICMNAFKSERAVLVCGHSFHLDCLEWFKRKQTSTTHIRCPFKCKARTKFESVMIASDKRSDDGTKSQRNIRGDFGTKVNALVGDLLGVSDNGEKSVVFSQFDDMLDILQEALALNGLKYVRASSRSKIGLSTKRFLAEDCFVLLLNVKQGAEGLNLIEATHVFMIEPLLNCGIDSQAIARVHRIGQTRQTFVHRYLIEETVEIKVDRYRREHQESSVEEAIMETRKCAIQAGGFDGGFGGISELRVLLE